MVDINKPWHIIITQDNYNIINKWWKSVSKSDVPFYNKGICGMYLKDKTGLLTVGMTEGKTKGYWGTFGEIITLEQFTKYILKEKINNNIYELW